MNGRDTEGTPYAPHGDAETAAMLSAVGVDTEEALFDIPESVRFDGDFGIEARTEREIRAEMGEALARNRDLVELLVPEERRKGRGYGITEKGSEAWNVIQAKDLTE